MYVGYDCVKNAVKFQSTNLQDMIMTWASVINQ